MLLRARIVTMYNNMIVGNGLLFLQKMQSMKRMQGQIKLNCPYTVHTLWSLEMLML